MNRLYSILILLLVLSSCANTERNNNKETGENRITQLLNTLNDSESKQIMVVAHRADWRNAPENSIAAIESAIEIGVDIVEIDVRMTKDGFLVLMHDKTVDRTTSGEGMVSDWTLDSLKTLFLRDGCQTVTAHKIPTLDEALTTCKGKVLINLDKSYSIINECVAIADKTGTTNQIIIKGNQPFEILKKDFEMYLDEVIYMPIYNLSNSGAKKYVEEFIEGLAPVAFEFTVASDTIAYLKEFHAIRNSGSRIWVNALWPHHNAGHDDERAFYNPEVYDWFIENDINIIQTDRPALLLEYLRKNGLHN